MPLYQFSASSEKGRNIKGSMQAKDDADLIQQLKRIGLTLHYAREWDGTQGMGLVEMLCLPFTWLSSFFEWMFVLLIGQPTPKDDPKRFERERAMREHIRRQIVKGDTSTMPTFSYVAKTQKGRTMRGEMEAADENDLRNRLRVLEMDMVRGFEHVAQGHKADGGAQGAYRVPLSEQLILAQQLELYFRLDMRVPEMLDAIRVGCEPARLRKLLLRVRHDVVRGDSLYTALSRFPKETFSRFFMSVMEVGELTGQFSGVLMYATRHLKWMEDVARNAKRRLSWQKFSVGAIGALLAFSIALRQGPQLLVEPLIFLAALWVFCRAPWLKEARSRVLFVLPFTQEMMTRNDVLHFTYLFSMMWSAGIVVCEAIEKAAHSVRGHEMREALMIAQWQVDEGEKPSRALAQSGMFNTRMINAFTLAETTGNFEAALEGVYYFERQQLENSVDRLIDRISIAMYAVCVLMVVGIYIVMGTRPVM